MRFILLLSFLVQSVTAATYYVEYTSGSDANNGTAKGTPWKKSPGMKGFAGAYSHTAGDVFVFKGGVTWPSACFQMLVVNSGSGTSVRDTYTVDASWYAGGSYSAPVWDSEHVLMGNGWENAASVRIQGSWITFDGILQQNHRAPLEQAGVSTWGSTAFCINNASHITFTNLVVRNFDQPLVSGTVPSGAGGGGAIMLTVGGSDNLVTHCEIYQDTAAYRGGTAIWNIGYVRNCSIHDLGGSAIMAAWDVSDNEIYNLVEPMDPAAHANAIYLFTPGWVYNNKIHDTSTRAQVIYLLPNSNGGSGIVYVWNNIVYSTAQPCVVTDMDGADSSGCGLELYNNTLVAPGGTGTCVRIAYKNSETWGSINVRNNHFITSGSTVCYNNTLGGCANVLSVNIANNLTHSPAVAASYGYTSTNFYAPTLATSPTYNTGVDLSGVFTNDYANTARPQGGTWDIGAWEFVPAGGGTPGTLVLAAASVSVSESSGTVTVTISRTGGTSGAVGVSYATANGDATSGVNYTAMASTKSWANGDSADKTFTVPILSVPFYGNKSFTVTLGAPSGGAVLGTPSVETITINGTGSPPIVLLGTPPWTSPSTLSAPFAVTGSYYSQPDQTAYGDGGKAIYYFTNAAGTYTFYATVRCLSDSDNSVYFAVNGTPGNPANVYNEVVPTGATEAVRAISQQGTGTFDNPQYPTYQVTLAGGVTNRVEVWGREGGMRVYDVNMVLNSEPADPPSVLATTLTTPNGYYKATSNILATVTFSTNVVVTGTPRITNNAGGVFSYASGSGTTSLVFTYTVAVGQNSQALDYMAPISLALNGGTIRNGVTDATLTLPAPGTVGSLAYGRSVVIDTVAPTIVIGPASAALSPGSSTVFYAVAYSDSNFDRNTLVNSNVTLNGTSSGSISVSTNNPGTTASVALSSLTTGTGSITIAAGTAQDRAGNLAPGAGPSSGFTISGTQGNRANVLTIKAGTIVVNK